MVEMGKGDMTNKKEMDAEENGEGEQTTSTSTSTSTNVAYSYDYEPPHQPYEDVSTASKSNSKAKADANLNSATATDVDFDFDVGFHMDADDGTWRVPSGTELKPQLEPEIEITQWHMQHFTNIRDDDSKDSKTNITFGELSDPVPSPHVDVDFDFDFDVDFHMDADDGTRRVPEGTELEPQLEPEIEITQSPILHFPNILDDDSKDSKINTTLGEWSDRFPSSLVASTQDPPALSPVQVPVQVLVPMDKRYPPPLYCPLTHQVFQDPVVAPDGLSYERDVILQLDALTKDQVYPNRALQQILDEEPKFPLLEQLWERSLWPPDRPLADAYYCPITFDLMHVPVIDPEGNTYEEAAIVHWIRANGHSPISRRPLAVAELYPNHVIRQLLEFHANDKPNHAALSKWKSEPPPSVPEPTDPPVYPSTFEELEAHRNRMRRQRQKMVACTVLGVVCLVLAITAAVAEGGYCIFISIWIGCCVRDSFRRLRQLNYEHQQDQRVLQETQQRVQALQERLQQFSNMTTTNQRANGNGNGNGNENEQGSQTLQLLEQRLEQLRLQQSRDDLSPSVNLEPSSQQQSVEIDSDNGVHLQTHGTAVSVNDSNVPSRPRHEEDLELGSYTGTSTR